MKHAAESLVNSSVFFAYPAKPHQIGDSIRVAVEELNKRQSAITFKTWEQSDVAGRPIISPIISEISRSSFFVADITKLNLNVIYEIGYSIGKKRRVILVRNSTIAADDEIARLAGIFDTLGYFVYQNAQDIVDLLSEPIDLDALNTNYPLDRKAPTYILETPGRSEAMVRMVGRVKKARLRYRSFAPSEDTRMAASDAIFHVASSFGVLVPFLEKIANGSAIHNMRAAFVAGLSHGMEKSTLILNDGSEPLPLDIRDYAKYYRHPNDIDDHIQEFALEVYEAIQSASDVEFPERGYLANLFVGDPMAENELQTLKGYYLPTHEFDRALRGEVNLVVGRKGTGKTAFFSQMGDQLRRDRQNIVVDLKPEGYQLVKLKEDVLDYLSQGAKGHLITAFWEYLLLMEVSHKILEKDRQTHLRDQVVYQRYRRLSEVYRDEDNVREGDFSERLLTLTDNLVNEFRASGRSSDQEKLTADEVTNLLHIGDLRKLRRELSEYLKTTKSTWVLFDNLDKGWTTQGLTRGDIVILRCLIDAARKIQREMQRDKHEFYTVVFVRNDVYQLLMDQTADFGKEMPVSLDWSDPDRLRELMRKRLIVGTEAQDLEFYNVWGRLMTTHYMGEESSTYLIDRSLMRPRYFLKLFGHCRSSAVNLNHEKIEDEDVEKGMRNYSDDIIVDADQELTDIESSANGLIYQFIDEGKVFNRSQIETFMENNNVPVEKYREVLEFLLYYGFLGVGKKGEEPRYIYQVGYDTKKLNALMAKNRSSVAFTLNPVFWPGLGVG